MPTLHTHGKRGVTRRTAIKTATLAAGWSIIPRAVLGRGAGTPPSDRVALAFVGVGSQGLRVMMEFIKHEDVQAVAVCDVNAGSDDFSEWGRHELRDKVRTLIGSTTWGERETYRGGIAGRGPAKEVVEAYYAKNARSGTYSGCAAVEDYRQLLAKAAGFDGVVIGTPDHLHAPVAVAAMRAGKHVFCQKPMSHSIAEAHRMAAVASETKVATQVAIGNQASEATRQLCEWVWSGAIGSVREVVNWSDRPYWPQGIARPEAVDPVPAYLNWDLWLGPAPVRPYNAAYQPFVWRGWTDFGAGAIGDMGCYSFDTIFRVLKLEAPTMVEGATASPMPETFPKAEILYFDFPSRGDMPPVRVTWYDGGLRPSRPSELGDTPLEPTGLLFVGDRGAILCGFNGARPRLIPAETMSAFRPPAPTLPRSPGNDREWLNACKGGPAGGANFAFSARVTETVLLGNIAARAGQRLTWDPGARRITNADAANQHLGRSYRTGWEI
jgi:predicted dehydrogenase